MPSKKKKGAKPTPSSVKPQKIQAIPDEAMINYQISRKLEKLINLSFKQNSLSEILTEKKNQLSQIEFQIAENKKQAVEDGKRLSLDQQLKRQFTSGDVEQFQEETLALKAIEEQKLKCLEEQICETEENIIKVKAEINDLDIFSTEIMEANAREIDRLNSEIKAMDMRLEAISQGLFTSLEDYQRVKNEELEQSVDKVCHSVTKKILTNLDNYLKEELKRNSVLVKEHQLILDEYNCFKKQCEELEMNCLQLQERLFEKKVLCGLRRADSSTQRQVRPESNLQQSHVLDLKFIDYFKGDGSNSPALRISANEDVEEEQEKYRAGSPTKREERLMALGPFESRLLFVEGKSKEICAKKISDWPVTFDALQQFKETTRKTENNQTTLKTYTVD